MEQEPGERWAHSSVDSLGREESGRQGKIRECSLVGAALQRVWKDGCGCKVMGGKNPGDGRTGGGDSI